MIGRTLAALGHGDETRTHYHDLVAPGAETIPRNIRWHWMLAGLSRLCVDFSDADGVKALRTLLDPVADQHGVIPLETHYAGPFTAILSRLRVLQGELRGTGHLIERALASP